MAKIKMSSVGITAISGKAGGSVFSRNRGGAYVKNFVKPSNTFSEFRQAVRSAFGALASTWRTLTDAQRNSFFEQAPFYKKLDVFADLKTLSPMALYQKLNLQLANAGLPHINSAIAPEGTNAIIGVDTPLAVSNTAGEISFTYQLEDVNNILDNSYVLEATPSVSPSIKNVSNLFRKLLDTNTTEGNPVNAKITFSDFASTNAALYTAYVGRFGVPAVGSIVHIRLQAVNPRTGEASAYWYAQAKVA